MAGVCEAVSLEKTGMSCSRSFEPTVCRGWYLSQEVSGEAGRGRCGLRFYPLPNPPPPPRALRKPPP